MVLWPEVKQIRVQSSKSDKTHVLQQQVLVWSKVPSKIMISLSHKYLVTSCNLKTYKSLAHLLNKASWTWSSRTSRRFKRSKLSLNQPKNPFFSHSGTRKDSTSSCKMRTSFWIRGLDQRRQGALVVYLVLEGTRRPKIHNHLTQAMKGKCVPNLRCNSSKMHPSKDGWVMIRRLSRRWWSSRLKRKKLRLSSSDIETIQSVEAIVNTS